jgi:anti-anti-sigma factor
MIIHPMAVMTLAVQNEFCALPCGDARDLHALARLEFPVPQQTTARPPIHLALVLDRSGSMEGRKLDLTKQAATFFMNWLTRRDFLTVVTYADNVEVLVPHTQLTDKRAVAEKIKTIISHGSTNLSGGWRRGLAELQDNKQAGHVHRLVLLTDGRANIGVIGEDELGEIAAKNRERDVVTTAVGFGDDFDEALLKAVAKQGGGQFHYVKEPESLASAFQSEFGDLAAMVAQNVECALELADGVTLADALLDLPATHTEHSLQVQLGDARAGDVKLILVKLRLAQKLCAQPGRAVLGKLIARCDPIAGDMLPEHQRAALTVDFVPAGAPPSPVRDVQREVWLAEGARMKLAVAQQLIAGDAAACAQTLRKHADAAASMAQDPTEALVRDEIARLYDLARQAESVQERASVSKVLTHSATQFTTRRGTYAQAAGVRQIRADVNPQRPEEALDVISTVEKAVKLRGFEPERVDRIKTILRELLDNAIEHGCAGRPSGKIAAECDISDNYARMVVTDDGPGFDCAKKLQQEELRTIAPGQRGRGLLLIKRMADRVLWQTDKGTRAEAVVERRGLRVAAEHAPKSAVHGPIREAFDIASNTLREAWLLDQELNAERGIVILKPKGSLDARTFSVLEQAIAELFGQGRYRIIVDMTHVEYISSAGAGVFIGAVNEAQSHGGNVVLVSPAASVREVFDLLGLGHLFRICNDLPTAYTLF